MTPKDYQKLVGKQIVVHSSYQLPWKPEHGKYTLYDIHTGIPYENENKVTKHYWHLASIDAVYQSNVFAFHEQPANSVKGGLYLYKISYQEYNICNDDTWTEHKDEALKSVIGSSNRYIPFGTIRASDTYYSYYRYTDVSNLSKIINNGCLSWNTIVPIESWMTYHHNKIKELESFISSQGTIERMAI